MARNPNLPEPPNGEGPLSSRLEALLFELLDRLEREGWPGVERVLREHPRDGGILRRRLRYLIDLGLVEGEEEA